ncbi:hypothetical protein [Aeromicrobium sp. 179-A 4D2 NHS]|uniref:hypothetical protein n=1 Tax=Aeromicrobium sp. 179-A 4D2 NHS TaxID=3142375 RepID=UPI0039A2762E
MRAPLWALTLVAAVALCVACRAQGTTAPLVEDGYGGEYCQPTAGTVRLTYGAGMPENTSDSPVRVTGVELTHAVGMELVGAKLMQVPAHGPGEAIGALGGWPPDFEGDRRLEADFDAAPPLDGAVIPPSRTEIPHFVVGIRATPGGHAGPVKVTYTSEGDEFTWTGRLTYRAAGAGGC